VKPYPLYIITLTAAFVALDVTGRIDWAWWQVTMPILITFVISFIGFTLDSITKDKDG
jgi:hypothetical protein